VEQSAVFAREAAAHYDELIVGAFPDALAGRGMRFACIVFNDVLEHMVDPWSALRRARDHLRPDGVVVASIPNVRNARTVFDLVVRGRWTYVDMGVLDRTHLRFFTKNSVDSLFRDSGYSVDRLYGINALGRSRPPLGSILPKLLGEFAYTGLAIRAVLGPPVLGSLP
jgi:SAM-dependent methyltransferase